MFADKIFYGGTVATVNSNFDFAEAVAVKDGRILFVGSNEEAMKTADGRTEKIDLKGGLLLPGIHDSHVHTSDYINNMQSLDCSGAETVEELKALIAERKENTASGWILGNGLGNGVLSAGLTRLDMDEVSGDVPVVIVMWHGHGCAANTAALKASGITRDTPSPTGGTVERDENGEPTGVLQEASAMQMAFRGMPRFTVEEIKNNLVKVQKFMNSMGYTAYTECTAGPANDEREGGASGTKCLEAYKQICSEGNMTCRVSVGFYSGRNGIQSNEILIEDIPKVPKSDNKDWLKFNMLKFFCDGVHLSHTAWMKNDYADAPGNHGFSCFGDGSTSDEEQTEAIFEILKTAHKSGHQIGIHTIGDKAVQVAADAIIAAQKEYPREDCRHYLIHADSFGDTEEFEKCAANGIYISSQPNLAEDMYEISIRCVGEKGEKLMGLREMLDAGVVVAGGSDSIAGEFHDWIRGIRCAVCRRSATGAYYRQDLAATLEEAVAMYTINAAKQEFAEKDRGSVEKGKFADFTVVDKNIFAIPFENWADLKAVMTVVDGNIVYKA